MKKRHFNDDINIQKSHNISMSKWVFTGVLLIILMVIFYTEAHKRIDELIKRDVEQHFKAILNTTEATLEMWIHEREDEARHLANRPDVVKLVSRLLNEEISNESLSESQNLKEIRHILNPYLREKSDLGFFVVNKDYVNIGSMRDENLGEVNLLKEHGKVNYFNEMFYGRSVVVLPLRSDVALLGDDGVMRYEVPTMFFGVPIFEDDKVIAAYLVRVDPKKDFTRIVGIARFGETGDPYVIDDKGNIITHSRFKSDLVRIGMLEEHQTTVLNIQARDPGCDMTKGCKPKLERSEQPFTEMAMSLARGDSGHNVEGYNDYRGVPVVGAWIWNKEHSYGLVMEQDVNEAFEKFYTIRRIFVTSFLLVTALFSLYSFLAIQNNRELNIEIAQRIQLEKDLTRLANTDSLTGAFNRAKFDSIIDVEVARAIRFEHELSLIIMDIDFFKAVNDKYGHLVGDRVLKDIATIVNKVVRITDSFVRWGGEEFMVLAVETDLSEVFDLAERLRRKIEHHSFEDVGKVTVSFGVATYNEPESVDDFLTRADDALYRAKEGGRNMVVKAG